MYQLTADKTKMVKLLRSKGYTPAKNATFTKAFRARTWWLEWFDNTGSYNATLSTAAGSAFLGIRFNDSENPEKWTAFTLPMSELKAFDLLETVQPSPAQICEPEL